MITVLAVILIEARGVIDSALVVFGWRILSRRLAEVVTIALKSATTHPPVHRTKLSLVVWRQAH
jgi:hypothetical protein